MKTKISTFIAIITTSLFLVMPVQATTKSCQGAAFDKNKGHHERIAARKQCPNTNITSIERMVVLDYGSYNDKNHKKGTLRKY